jgi:hypothetical protein
MPSPVERRKRERLIKNIVRLDAETVWSDIAKELYPRELFTDPTRLVADPTQLSAWQGKIERTIGRKVVDRSPLLEWHFKHHSPAGALSDSLLHGGNMLEAFVGALQVPPTEAHIAEKRRLLAAKRREIAAGTKNIGSKVKRAADVRAAGGKFALRGARPRKGEELKEALQPMVSVEYRNIIEAARRNPVAALRSGLLWRSTRTAATLALWRASGLTGVGDKRSIMDAFLCQAGLTVATCRALTDPTACAEGSECRNYLDGSCSVPEEY